MDYRATKTNFKNKNVLVMGLGLHEGGIGTVKFLIKEGARVTVTDLRSKKVLEPALTALKRYRNIVYVLGRHRKKDFIQTDYILKNPGVPPHSLHLKFAQKHNVPILSDMGIFFNLCPARIIGVTGSRGKSTAAYLIAQFLRSKYKKVFLAGNIQVSVLSMLSKLKAKDWVVLELSSFQLHDMQYARKSPHIAVLTTILPDHLNWHRTFSDYVAAKKNIFKFQKHTDFLFLNPADTAIKKIVHDAPSHIIRAKLPVGLTTIVDKNLGKHYRISVGLAVAVARYAGVSPQAISRTLKNFRGLTGRQEHIAVVRGVHFVNDTTATVPEATAAALDRFGRYMSENNSFILIAGGGDKNLSYRMLAEAIKKRVRILVLLPGTATNKLKQALHVHHDVKIYQAKSMKEAVKKAYHAAEKGDWIVLSPGATSFNLFANEFDRGEQFLKAVRDLS